MTTAGNEKGLLASLFDFGFTSFITLRFLRIIYTLVVVIICGLALLFYVSLARQGFGAFLLASVVVPVVTLLYLVFARVGMELIALLFRMGEDLKALRVGGGPGEPFRTSGTGYGPGPVV